MKTASRTWKAGGKRLDSRGAGVPPARRLESGKQAKTPMFSVISHPPARLEAAPPEVPRWLSRSFQATSRGCGILPRRGRMGGQKAAPHLVTCHCATADGEREGRTHAEARRRGGLGGGGFCTKGQKGNKRGIWRAGGMPTLKTMKTASRTWKEGGERLCSRGACVPPVRRLESGKQAKTPMFSVISHPPVRLEAAPPEVPQWLFRRSRAASGGAPSCRAGGEWAAKRPPRILSLVTIHLSLRHSGWRAGGKNSRGGAEARRAWRGRILHKRTKRKQKGQLESGRNANIEKHENRFADMERGRGATGQSGRGRPARGASGKRKTSENSNAFCNLAPAMDSTSGGAASCRAMADGERVNGSRKVRNVRKGLERCRAMPRSMGRQGARFLRLGVCVWLCFDSNYAHGKMRVFPSGYLARFALIPIMRMAKCEEQPDVIRKALP